MSLLSKLIVVVSVLLVSTSAATGNFKYGEALQKSIYFYEAQQAGKIPSWNRVPWRGDSVLGDGSDVGIDLSGGWFDAGDHVKFGFPMAATTTMLAWGAVDYRDAYENSGQLDDLLRNLQFVNDFFIAAHPTPNELYGHVGLGNQDHSFWVPAEVVDQHTSGASRPAFKIDLSCKGPDLAAETAAAMASSSMVFQPTNATYSATLLSHARDLYSLALATVGTDGVENNYANCITDAAGFYNAGFGVYWDEMAWGAMWLWRATGEDFYLTKAREFYDKMGFESQTSTPVFTWSQGWNDKAYGVYVLAANLIGDQRFHDDAQRYLDHWIDPNGGDKTSGGIIIVDRFNGWGSMRYAANTAFLSLYYADGLGTSNSLYSKYHDFGVNQIDYILGDNPRNSSYVVGFGNNPPVNVHHRTSHGSWSRSETEPAEQRHILYGALVGGPASTDDFDYVDNRSDFKRNEVAVDYNSGFTSAVARMYKEFGGEPLADSQFPPAEPAFEEYVVGAQTNSSSSRLIEIKGVIQNKSTAPARARSDLYFRYFVDLTEVVNAGLSASDVTVSAAFNQGSSVSQLKTWGDPQDNIFYTEVRFDGVVIYPGGQSEFRKEVQFRLALPNNSSVTWDNSNDPSWDNAYDSASGQLGITAPKIPVYGSEGLLFGQEPSPQCGSQTGVNCIPVANSVTASTEFETPVAIVLDANDSDGTIVSYQTSNPSNGTLSGSGANLTYTPANGFSGNDSFTYEAVDNQGAMSNSAQVTITVADAVIPSVSIQSPADNSNVVVASNFQLTFSRANADSVRILLGGAQVANNFTGSSISLQAPANIGLFSVEVIALDASGAPLNASDSIQLNAIEQPQNSAPTASFVATTSGLSVSVDGSGSSDPDGDTLTYQWDFGDGTTASGVNASHTYAAGTYTITLTVSDSIANDTSTQMVTVEAPSGGANCEYIVQNEWNTGFVAVIRIQNNTNAAINGWNVSWQYTAGHDRSSGWNAQVSGSNPYTATPLGWNSVIEPGQFVEFGMQGTKPDGQPAEVPNVTGDVCQ